MAELEIIKGTDVASEAIKKLDRNIKAVNLELEEGGAGGGVELVDNLNQEEAGKALDARQGKILAEMVNSIVAGDVTYLGIASTYGVDESIGDNDATDLLNNYFAELKAKGLKYAYFDKPHTYLVSGELTEARDLILCGNATIKSNNLNNYYIQICNTLDTYTGKYNVDITIKNAFDTITKAIKVNKTVNVCIWGDSISTGNDCIGVTYNNKPTMIESGVSGITDGESYYLRLIDMLVEKFKDVTFNFYNRAISSTTIQEWQNEKNIGGATKTWITHVKDTNPDLLIIAFGMNNSAISSGKEFAYCMDQIVANINATFTKKPSIAWVTVPRPVLALDSSWGSTNGQLGRELAAYGARVYGKSMGHYIIDVNKVSNIKRIGKTFENPYMYSVATNDTDLSSIISGNYIKDGTEYVISNTDYIQLNGQYKDFVLEFDINFGSGLPNNSDNLRIGYNYGLIESQQSSLLLMPKNPTGKIRNFSGYLDSTHWAEKPSFVDVSAWDNNAYKTFRIEKRGEIVDVSIDGVRVMSFIQFINNIHGHIKLIKNGVGTEPYIIKNIKLYEGRYRHYLPTLTEYEMWGEYEDEIYTTKPYIGGNGVNHPSTIGIEEVYVPALKEFIDDLSKHSEFITLDNLNDPFYDANTNLWTGSLALTTTPQEITLNDSILNYKRLKICNGGASNLAIGEVSTYINESTFRISANNYCIPVAIGPSTTGVIAIQFVSENKANISCSNSLTLARIIGLKR